MRIVVALGGNALLERNQAMTAEQQRLNVRVAARALAPLAAKHQLVITHGNGPQVGLLALQGAAYQPDQIYPLDILDAETEGMIGYLIEQELRNRLTVGARLATLLTQIEVDPSDSAFKHPTKPIGPTYTEAEALQLAAENDWAIAPEGEAYRRVVASPQPQRILELAVIKLLVEQGVIVICAGGGGIPTVTGPDGCLTGIEAVIDKDSASLLLARELDADAFIMLTDVDAVYENWGSEGAEPIRRISAQQLRRYSFAAGSMGPKVNAGCEFVEHRGGFSAIGQLSDLAAILEGEAGTTIIP